MIEYFDGNCTEENTAPIPELTKVIRSSFLTVAVDFNITKKNAPRNPAFMTPERLAEIMETGSKFWVYKQCKDILGCVSIAETKEEDVFMIELLSVLPEYRHKGIGKELLNFACNEIYLLGGKKVHIGIIEENTILKKWYEMFGFAEIEIKKVSTLPFTVCVMEKELKDTAMVDESQRQFDFLMEKK